MKNFKSIILVMFLLVGTTMTAQLMSDVGNVHNFMTGTTSVAYNFAVDNGGTCSVCHTPHNAASTNLPLWDHAASATSFTAYTSTTMQGASNLAGGSSLLCLGCHDGTASLDSYGSVAAGAGAVTMSNADAIFDASLQADHPIGVTYPANGDAPTEQMVLAATATAGGIALYTNKVECSSCHSVHNPAVNAKLLRVANTNSELCLTCHAK